MRVIANGNQIYQLDKGRSVVIPVQANYPSLVVTDGYHFTKPVRLNYNKVNVQYLTVACVIDDDRLIAGLILTALFYGVGLTSGILLVQVLSFLPILYFLYLFYVNRRQFLKLRLA